MPLSGSTKSGAIWLLSTNISCCWLVSTFVLEQVHGTADVCLQGDWAGVWDTLTFHWGTQKKPSFPRLSSPLSCVDRTETWNLFDIADATSGCPITVLVLVYSHSAVLCDCTPIAENCPEHQLPHWQKRFMSQGESVGYSFCLLCCLVSVFQKNIHWSCFVETWLMMRKRWEEGSLTLCCDSETSLTF